MKKTFVLLFVAFAGVFCATAQQGEKWVGGGLTIQSNDNGAQVTTSSFGFDPEIGFVLSDKFAVGAALVIQTSKTENGSTDEEDKYNTVGLKPFVRYYFGQAGKFSFFGQGELPILSTKHEHVLDSDNVVESKYSMVGLRARPCIAYDFNDKFAAELLMPSLFYFSSYSGDRDDSEFGLLFNSGYSIQDYLLSPTISFVYKF